MTGKPIRLLCRSLFTTILHCKSFFVSCLSEITYRDEFNLKLALLSNQWQGVVRRAQQRRGIIDGLIRQWQRYREMVDKLRKWLLEVSHRTETLQAGNTVPLQQARTMLDAVQVHSDKPDCNTH